MSVPNPYSSYVLLCHAQEQFYFYLVKVKLSRYRPGMAQRVGTGIALLFHDRGTRRGEWSAARPGRTLPPGKTRYPLYRRLGGPQGRSGCAENLVPIGIRSRTVQVVVSRYTDWTSRPTPLACTWVIFLRYIFRNSTRTPSRLWVSHAQQFTALMITASFFLCFTNPVTGLISIVVSASKNSLIWNYFRPWYQGLETFAIPGSPT